MIPKCNCGKCRTCRHRAVMRKSRWRRRWMNGYDGPVAELPCLTRIMGEYLRTERNESAPWMLRAKLHAGIID